MLPNFLVIGAQKCGTTSLHEYFQKHPEIYLPKCKETKYFINEERYAKGLGYYEREHYSGWGGEVSVGEVDPDLLYYPDALERIRRDLEFAKLRFIVILRNPVDRAFSHFLMTYRRGIETLSFEEAIEIEQERIKKGYFERTHFSYIDRGFYARDIKRFLEAVPPRRMLFLKTDDLKAQPQSTVKKCLSFLEVEESTDLLNLGERHHAATVPRYPWIARWLKNESKSKQLLKTMIPINGLRRSIKEKLVNVNLKGAENYKVQSDTRHTLIERYRADIKEVERLAGLKTGEWLKDL